MSASIRLLLACCLFLLAAPAAAETVRVVIARGASLQVVGERLEARAEGADAWVPVGHPLKVELGGRQVKAGSLRSTRLSVRDADGAVVRVQGRAVLGQVELLVVDGKLAAVDVVELETYVASVLGGEMPSSWPAAALEAQAVAARTYALSRKLQRLDAAWHMEPTVTDQVYAGTSSLAMSTVLAAQATAGLVLTHQGELAQTFFFSNCRGKTESAKAGFGQEVPYLVPVPCLGGESSPTLAWERRIPVKALAKRLKSSGALGDELKSIAIVTRTATGRVATAALETKHGGRRLVTGPQLRQLIGWSELPSLDVDVKVAKGDLVFSGRGAGHGVGLCQWCARGQAENGRGSDQILSHFYPGTELRRIESAGAGRPPRLVLADAQ